jgi:tyrosinase
MAFSQTSVPLLVTRRGLHQQAAATDIKTLSKAIGLMLSKHDETDPKSWMYWANVHGMQIMPPAEMNGIWDTCDHQQYFLVWHRMYLYFFEALVRDLTNESTFAMPYWDWYRSRDLPPAFAEEKTSGVSNHLWRDGRGYSLQYSVSTNVLTNSHADAYAAFNTFSFGDPHSNIHGNFAGEMSTPSTAARDPVFWPHHVMMDRLWEMWLANNPLHKSPSPSDPWSNRKFSFTKQGPSYHADVAKMISMTDLHYQYDNLDLPGLVRTTPASPKEVENVPMKVVTQRDIGALPMTLSVASRAHLELGATGSTLRFPLHHVVTDKIRSMQFSRMSVGDTIRIVLDGVRLTEEGARLRVSYGVYVNLPQDASNEPDHPYYLGQIDSFGLAAGHHHATEGSDFQHLEFPIDSHIASLAATHHWDPTKIDVSFVPNANFDTKKPTIEIGEVRVDLGQPSI